MRATLREHAAMIVTKKLAPPHSVLLVMDPGTGEPPRTMRGGVVAATRSCLAIGTLAEVDGQTVATLADASDSPAAPPDMRLVYDGVIATPSREVHLCTTALESVAGLPVTTTMTRVRVWANRSTEPDRVLIVISGLEVIDKEGET